MTKLRLPEQNSVVIVGRLTHDPDVKHTTKGQAFCRLSVAVNRSYKDAKDEWQKDVSFIPVVCWGDIALQCGQRLKRGSPVHVQGRLKSGKWEDKTGQSRTSLDVVAKRIQFLQTEGNEDGPENEEQPVTENHNVPASAPVEEAEPF